MQDVFQTGRAGGVVVDAQVVEHPGQRAGFFRAEADGAQEAVFDAAEVAGVVLLGNCQVMLTAPGHHVRIRVYGQWSKLSE
ncbi:hypothetical protein D9M73_186520 [compost metagenome]